MRDAAADDGTDAADGDAGGDVEALEPDSMEVEPGSIENASDVAEEAEPSPIHDAVGGDTVASADLELAGAAAEDEVPDGLPLFPAESVVPTEEPSEAVPVAALENDTLLACLKLKMQAKQLILV